MCIWTTGDLFIIIFLNILKQHDFFLILCDILELVSNVYVLTRIPALVIASDDVRIVF